MNTRQVVGKRRTTKKEQARGTARRKALLSAARHLLNQKSIEDIGFREIADIAGVPEGSAYHFFANKFDLFAALLAELSTEFLEAHKKPYDTKTIINWTDLSDLIIQRTVDLYRADKAAQQLSISGKTPLEIKKLERQNNVDFSSVYRSVFDQHFCLPSLPEEIDIFVVYIEITDTIFMLSMIENGAITDPMLREAQRVGSSYLSNYLPAYLEKR